MLSLADGGQVLVTQAVVESLAGSGRRFDDRGVHSLTGVDDSWAVSAVDAS